jgi:hypothetical protein
MDPLDFLVIADRYKRSDKEAERRTSIGRSYYGLYNFLVGVLSSKGVIFRETPEDHQMLISYLIKAGHARAAQAGQAVKDMRKYRNDADYRMSPAINASMSEFVYKKAVAAIDGFKVISGTELDVIIERIQAMP